MKKDTEFFCRVQIPMDLNKILDYVVKEYNRQLELDKYENFIENVGRKKMSKSKLIRYLLVNYFFKVHLQPKAREYEILKSLELLDLKYKNMEY